MSCINNKSINTAFFYLRTKKRVPFPREASAVCCGKWGLWNVMRREEKLGRKESFRVSGLFVKDFVVRILSPQCLLWAQVKLRAFIIFMKTHKHTHDVCTFFPKNLRAFCASIIILFFLDLFFFNFIFIVIFSSFSFLTHSLFLSLRFSIYMKPTWHG